MIFDLRRYAEDLAEHRAAEDARQVALQVKRAAAPRDTTARLIKAHPTQVRQLLALYYLDWLQSCVVEHALYTEKVRGTFEAFGTLCIKWAVRGEDPEFDAELDERMKGLEEHTEVLMRAIAQSFEPTLIRLEETVLDLVLLWKDTRKESETV